jgi:hypothetical protein
MSRIARLLQSAASNTQPSLPAGQSLSFTGGNSYIYNFSAQTDFGSGDFTLEAWFKLDAAASPANYSAILGQNYGSNGGALYVNANGLEYYQGTTNAAGGAVSVDVWYHAAVTRQGGTVRLHLDGINVASGTSDPITDDDLFVGASSPSPNSASATEEFNGLIYRPRWSNIARYSATSFTPDPRYENDADTVAFVVSEVSSAEELTQSLSLTTNNLSFSSDIPV